MCNRETTCTCSKFTTPFSITLGNLERNIFWSNTFCGFTFHEIRVTKILNASATTFMSSTWKGTKYALTIDYTVCIIQSLFQELAASTAIYSSIFSEIFERHINIY